jgi:NodT family efflux transporter outer membrane factor (OMF) lipoprotein
VLARALACGVYLVLPSCQIPHLRQPEPGPALPGGFPVSATGPTGGAPVAANSDPLAAVVGGVGVATLPAGATGASGTDNSSQLGVEEFYNDPMLTRLIHQAVANNRELKILEQEIQTASSEVLARQGAYLPFVTFGSEAGFARPSKYTPEGAVENQLDYVPGRHFPDPLPNYKLGFNLLWEVDVWRELRNARDAAAQRYVAATERRNAFVTRLVAEVAENYYRLMALDQRLETLDRTIELQQQSLEIAEAKKAAGRGTELAVQRFQAEVRKNQSEKLIVRQDIIETENRINVNLNRFPEPVERTSAGFFDINILLNAGVPAQLLANRPDVRQAERELAAAGLDVKVARAHFFPSGSIRAGVGFEAFNPKYLFNPEALIYNLVGEVTAPLINKKAIQAEYLSASARQLQSVYNYQRVILIAFTEVINRVSMAENYRKSIELRKQQLAALVASVETSSKLFDNARVEYSEVLFAQRDLLEARTVLIETKERQLSAIVNAYQALGGGGASLPLPTPPPPKTHHYWFQRVLLNPSGW